MDWKGSWYNQDIILPFAWRDTEKSQRLVSTVDDLAKMQTKYLPDTSTEYDHYTS
jgi:hypothetical protein